MPLIRVQTEDFDTSDIVQALSSARHDVGAIVSFTGLVRDLTQGGLRSLTLEHYPAMTEKAITAIVEAATKRWSLQDVAVIHRVGELKPSDQIVLVVTLSAHRKDAFDACEYIMDYLKSRAPFWKKEKGADGEDWVAAKDTDEDALKRW